MGWRCCFCRHLCRHFLVQFDKIICYTYFVLVKRGDHEKYIFVDSENVGDSWIQLFDYLNDDDCILVFYTDKSPNMSYANVVALKQSPFEPEFILCENGTDNALDFQLVTYLGSYTVKNPDDNLIIVSKDKGFDSVVHFWTERGYHVCRKAPPFSTHWQMNYLYKANASCNSSFYCSTGKY